MLKNIQLFCIRSLGKETYIDGRWLVLIFLICYFLLLLIAHITIQPYYIFWQRIGVSAVETPFYDLQVITHALDSYRQGNDPLSVFPKQSHLIETMFNYPRIWYNLAYINIRGSHTTRFGIILVLVFFITIFGFIKRINVSEAIIYGLILCSPAVMLLIERGNSDLIIFILLICASFTVNGKLLSQSAAALIFLLSCFLKLYPIFAIGFFLRHNPRTCMIMCSLIIFLFCTYVFLNRQEISLIASATPRAISISYGAYIYADYLVSTFNHSLSFVDKPLGHVLALITLLISAIVIFFAAMKLNYSVSGISSKNIDAFRLGAGIYMGTYLLGNNWDYRLVFLILTIPAILNWCKTISYFTNISLLALAGIILMMWNQIIYKVAYLKILKLPNPLLPALTIEEISNYLLFLYFFYIFLLTLPAWLKQMLFDRFLQSPQKVNNH